CDRPAPDRDGIKLHELPEAARPGLLVPKHVAEAIRAIRLRQRVEVLRHIAGERRGQIVTQAQPLLIVVLEREHALVRAILVGEELAERVGIFERGRLHRLEAVALIDRADLLHHAPRRRDLGHAAVGETARQPRLELVGFVGFLGHGRSIMTRRAVVSSRPAQRQGSGQSSVSGVNMPSMPAGAAVAVPNDLNAYWLPFTANRAFKKAPRLIARAKDMHYYTPEGRAVLDGAAGLGCHNAGHTRDPIVEAIRAQAAELDYAPAFQFAHPKAFELASRVAALAPKGLDRVFFCNSGSEAVDTALKIALAYHNVRGEGSRTRLIGRERGYHGVGFGGISVGGMVNNRKFFGGLLTGVDHLPATYDREHQAFTKGEPDWGAHLADELERIVGLHGPATIAAVIVEPMAGSTGVLPAPKGYLARLRAICDKHGILLIFDEVITAFGRLGHAFAAERYGVVPDMITFAKGITSGSVPMGGVLVRKGIYDAFMRGPMHAVELFHGYTYSAHPLACAAGL